MANLISILRILVVFISVIFIFDGSDGAYISALLMIVFAFSLDGVDGWVARKFNESSKLGAVLDIMGDRIAENTYWIVFAVLGWLPVTFPLIALTRTIVVDSLRSVAMEEKGCTAFGDCSMQKDKVGQFICCSKFIRILYAVAKAVAFFFIVIAHIEMLHYNTALQIEFIAQICAWFAIMLCVLRVLPVIFESNHFFVKEEK